MHNSIEIPLFIEIEENGLHLINETLRRLNIHINNPLIVTDKGKSSDYALIVKREMDIDDNMIVYVENNTIEQVDIVEKIARKKKCDFIIGVGGGLALDISKMASYKFGSYFISIPTLPSHDGISSPVASLRDGNVRKSMGAAMPMGIIVDLDVMVDAPKRFIHSGIMDLLSNHSALMDWELAFNKGYEVRFNGFAKAIASSAADNVLNYPYNDILTKEFLHLSINSLVLSGIAMEIAGSSRPASGAEHNFSHAYDMLYPDNKLLHGEKVGLGTLIISFIRSKKEYERMYACYKRFNLIESIRALNIPMDNIIKSVLKAKEIRQDRYTILTESSISHNEIEKIIQEILL